MRERTAEIQETWSKNIGRGVLQLTLPYPETTLTDEHWVAGRPFPCY